MSEVETFFRFCPSCGKRFHVKLVSKKMLGMRQEEETVKKIVPTMKGFTRYGPGSFSPVIVEEDVPIVVNIEDFQYQYKCKHCGHEWSENKLVQSKGYPSGSPG